MLETLPLFTDAEFCRIRGLDEPTWVDPDAGLGNLSTDRGQLPLVALDVRVRLDGLIATTEVEQTFVNSHDVALEATYIFPLPDRAAVTRFRLKVAGRVVEGELQERGKARQTYDQAIRAGHRAAIAEEDRAGVFTMRVGNLPPGERAVVELAMVGPVPFSDGEATFRFPLVVAPRYMPGNLLAGPQAGSGVAMDSDAVPDASRISPPVLLPGFPNPVRLSLLIEIPDSPLSPHSFRSSLHTVVEDQVGNARRLRVHPGERLDRDFVLRYRVAGELIRSGLVVRPDANEEGGTFLLTLVPPANGIGQTKPRNIVFVLDRSGSMSGWKMVAARRAVARMVETLTGDDRFTIYAFDDRIETPTGFDGLALVQASDRMRFRASEFLANVNDRGGTEMAQPLEEAVKQLEHTPAESQRQIVLITDGQVGNEDEILRRLGGRLGKIRVFTLGIDRAVNESFLRRLANLGGGSSEIVESESRLDEVMDQIHRQISTPVLTGLQLRAAGLDMVADSVVPGRLPDLFAGAPMTIAGRYRGKSTGALVLTGQDGQSAKWTAELGAWLDAKAPADRVWARGRVRELEDRYAVGTGDRAKLESEIVETSLRFGVLSRFTAYVAVDRVEVVNVGGQQKQVTQAVEQPSGWGQSDALMAQAAPSAPAGAMTLCGGFDLEHARREARSPAAPPPAPSRLSKAASMPMARLRMRSLGTDRPRYDQMDASESQTAGPKGFLSRLVGAVFGKGKQQATFDRSAFRSRAEDLLTRLRAAGDLAALLAGMQAELEAFVQDLVQSGEGNANVERLAVLLDGQPALLSAGAEEAALRTQHAELIAALEAWCKLLPATSETRSFWK